MTNGFGILDKYNFYLYKYIGIVLESGEHQEELPFSSQLSQKIWTQHPNPLKASNTNTNTNTNSNTDTNTNTNTNTNTLQLYDGQLQLPDDPTYCIFPEKLRPKLSKSVNHRLFVCSHHHKVSFSTD